MSDALLVFKCEFIRFHIDHFGIIHLAQSMLIAYQNPKMMFTQNERGVFFFFSLEAKTIIPDLNYEIISVN